MTVRVLVRSHAERDIDEAFMWYLETAPEYAKGFLEELSGVLGHISASPMIFRTVHNEVRKAALRRYPYFVWFVLVDDRAHVIAVSHKRQDPETARERVTSRI